jgi:hypothetical protein
MAHRTATALKSPAFSPTFGHPFRAGVRKVWTTLRLLGEAYGEGLDMARKAQRRGIFVE